MPPPPLALLVPPAPFDEDVVGAPFGESAVLSSPAPAPALETVPDPLTAAAAAAAAACASYLRFAVRDFGALTDARVTAVDAVVVVVVEEELSFSLASRSAARSCRDLCIDRLLLSPSRMDCDSSEIRTFSRYSVSSSSSIEAEDISPRAFEG